MSQEKKNNQQEKLKENHRTRTMHKHTKYKYTDGQWTIEKSDNITYH